MSTIKKKLEIDKNRILYNLDPILKNATLGT